MQVIASIYSNYLNYLNYASNSKYSVVYTRIVWIVQIKYSACASYASQIIASRRTNTREASLCEYMWVFEYLKSFFNIRACLMESVNLSLFQLPWKPNKMSGYQGSPQTWSFCFDNRTTALITKHCVGLSRQFNLPWYMNVLFSYQVCLDNRCSVVYILHCINCYLI